MARGIIAAVLALAATGCGQEKLADLPPAPSRGVAVSSPDFDDQGPIPPEDSCDGSGRRPVLRWSGVPAAARELAVVVTDPDAGGFVHWTLFGVPRATRSLASRGLPAGARQGTAWKPPCPPKSEQHRYLFDVYWLRRPSGLAAGAGPKAVAGALSAAAGGRGELVGRYHRAP